MRAWDAAETVRVDFIKTLVQSKKTPKDALRFISDSMGGHSYTVAEGLSKHHGFAAELLGGSDNYGELARITAKPSTRPETNMLAIVLAGFEKSLSRQSWRQPSPERDVDPGIDLLGVILAANSTKSVQRSVREAIVEAFGPVDVLCFGS